MGWRPTYRQSDRGWSTNFAYQGIFGLVFPLARGARAVADRRVPLLRRAGRAVLPRHQQPGGQLRRPCGAAGATRGNVNLNSDYNHSLLLGVRYAFNTAPPVRPRRPVAPQPAVSPTRTYLVFFDWDRADLTDRARQIIAEAAQASSRVQATQIEVQGNADRSGTPPTTSASRCAGRRPSPPNWCGTGCPGRRSTIQAFGDTRPLVPTAPGVREPQNRRVAIHPALIAPPRAWSGRTWPGGALPCRWPCRCGDAASRLHCVNAAPPAL